MKKFLLLFTTCFLCLSDCSAQNWLWAKGAQGSKFDYGYSVATDHQGNIYITGRFFSPTITFDSFTLINADTSGTTEDIFIVKYNSTGSVIWAKGAGGISRDGGYSITLDSHGNIYMAGYFRSSIISFDSQVLTNTNGYWDDSFICKYDPNGNVIWAKSVGGTKNDIAYSISADSIGNTFITGMFESESITFGPTTLMNADAAGFSSDIFIAKLDTNGNILWAKSAGTGAGTINDEGKSVSTDQDGNVFVTGYFRSNTISFDASTLTKAGSLNGQDADLFIAKFDSNGNTLWASRAGGTNYDFSYGISADLSGNVFLTGAFESNKITFGSNELFNTDTAGSYDFFIAKYDYNGNVLWAKSGKGISNEDGMSISSTRAGDLYVTGSFSSPSFIFTTDTLTRPPGSTDAMFVFKCDENGTVICSDVLSSGGFNNNVTTDENGNAFILGAFDNSPFIIGEQTLNLTGYQNIFLAKYECDGTFTAAINEVNKKEDLAVYPNPSSGIFTIASENKTVTNICVRDVLGNCILSKEKIKEMNPRVDLTNQTKGIYFVEITSEKNRITKKIVLQ